MASWLLSRIPITPIDPLIKPLQLRPVAIIVRAKGVNIRYVGDYQRLMLNNLLGTLALL